MDESADKREPGVGNRWVVCPSFADYVSYGGQVRMVCGETHFTTTNVYAYQTEKFRLFPPSPRVPQLPLGM